MGCVEIGGGKKRFDILFPPSRRPFLRCFLAEDDAPFPRVNVGEWGSSVGTKLR